MNYQKLLNKLGNITQQRNKLRLDVINLKAEIKRLKRLKFNSENKVDVESVSNIEYIYLVLKKHIESIFLVDISEKTRKREVVMARQIYYYWLRKNTLLSLYDISATLITLNHNHKSIIYLVNEFDNILYLNHDKDFIKKYKSICELMAKEIKYYESQKQINQTKNQ